MNKKYKIVFLILIFKSNFCDSNFLLKHVTNCILQAESEKSQLNDQVLSIQGYSGSKVRHLLNNLCALKNCNYLEIGTWKGSTFVAALFGNKNNINSAYAFDNWSQFGGKQEFLNVTNKFLNNYKFKFFELDCFKINISDYIKNKINIYFYDGHHSVESQKLAFTYYNEIFADTFIAIVDDYNWDHVKKGTQEAFKQLKYKILFEKYLKPNYPGDPKGWWNGLYIAVVSKN